MNDFDFELQNLEALNLTNKHSSNANKAYQEAYQRSDSKPACQYKNKKKKRKTIDLKVAITSIVLAATIAFGVGGRMAEKHIENNNAIISTELADDEINQKIKEYEQLMNHDSDVFNRIENYYGVSLIDGKYQESYDYNTGNLKNHLIEAAKISESEIRCVINAAYQIINEPYREEILGKALLSASQDQEGDVKYNIPTSTKEFLESLGYENWEEYNKNEVNNIKYLKAAEDYVGGKNR